MRIVEFCSIKCATKGCEHIAINTSRFCVVCRKKRLEEGMEVGVYGY